MADDLRFVVSKSRRSITSEKIMRFLFAALAALSIVLPAAGRDNGQWEAGDPAVSQWFNSLMQPDNPELSCCGDADGYFADSFYVDAQGRTIAIITDERPDEPLGRIHRPAGTEIEVPAWKFKWDRGNPTGHGILFLASGGQVLCYLTPGGV
jgi:hypothetical protein